MAIVKGILEPTDWKQDSTFKPLTNEKIIGINNLMQIAWLGRALELSRSVARIITPDGLGTGFMISHNMLMTNNHVIKDENMAKKSWAQFNYEESWGGKKLPTSEYKITSLVKTSPELDYTIVTVDGNPGKEWGFVSLENNSRTYPNDYVTIIQHPKGGRKQICLTDNKVSAVFKDTKNDVQFHKVQYTTDTEPGSSGSPVFNQDWKLVAIHHAGGMMKGLDGHGWFINEGIYILDIIEDSKEKMGNRDALADMALNTMRSSLVKLIKTKPTKEMIMMQSSAMIYRYPDLIPILNETVAKRSGNMEIAPLIAGIAGVAAGAAIRHWARSSGRESISENEVQMLVEPGETIEEIVKDKFSQTTLPYDYYLEIYEAVNLEDCKPEIKKIIPFESKLEVIEALPILVSCFIAGVYAGAKAYGVWR